MPLNPLRFGLRHWRGQVALWPTLLASVLGGRIALDAMTARLPPESPLAVVIVTTLVSLAVLVWQITGGLRALRVAGADGSATAAAVATVLITVALTANTTLNQFARRAAPAPAARAIIVPLPVDPEGRIVLHGEIGFDLVDRLGATIAAHPDARAVDLLSDGGQIYAARALAGAIAAHRLDTRASGLCASACTLVFIAGERRSLGAQGSMGFHGYAANLPQSLHPTAPEEARDRAFMAARGVAAAFLRRAYATPHDALWRPTRAELGAAGVLTPPD